MLSMDEPWDVMVSDRSQDQKVFDFMYMECPRVGNLIEEVGKD